MLIYVDQISERIVYLTDFIYSHRGLNVKLTNDQQTFLQANGDKLNYSEWDAGTVAQLKPADLLFESTINAFVALESKAWGDLECLSFNGIVDPLASAFYVLSRYEEYTCKKRDEHDRFQAKNSILFSNNWLKKQIVEHWLDAFVKTYNPAQYELWAVKKINVIPSFDIDNTFAYQWKEGWRTWLSIGKDVVKGNKGRREERKLVQSGQLKDPYDSFDEIEQVIERFPETRVFWLIGDMSEYDKNITWLDPRHQRLIRKFDSLAHLGLHPSYASNKLAKTELLEVERFKKIVGKSPSESRQHFLKLKLPQTYRSHIENGLKVDYTMGYAEQIGFRAGTAHPHFFFDLSRNETTNYQIVPFAYMDGTLNEYLKLNPAHAKLEIDVLVKEVKKFGGVFCFIWHNETLAESGIWKGWKTVFEYTLNQFEHEV